MFGDCHYGLSFHAFSRSAQLKVFVSYSRSDVDFADQLVAELTTLGIAPTIDREGIHGAERWQERLGQLILEADTVVFILTPASAVSPTCAWEVEQARLNKRILPIVWRPLGGAKPHEHLCGLNYIHFYEEPSIPGSGFGTGLKRLVDALTTEVARIREHTRLGELADRWEVAPAPPTGKVIKFVRARRLPRLGGLLIWRQAPRGGSPKVEHAAPFR
jgi:hypothetical protein